MKSLFKIVFFSLFTAMICTAGFGADPGTALAIGTSVNVITHYTLQYSPMMFNFIVAGSEYNGKENEEILFRPRFKGSPSELGFRSIFTNARSVKLTFFGPLGKILMPYVKGFQGGSGAPQIQKKLVLSEFKAETAYDKHDYFDTIKEQVVLRDGVNQNDISGTDVAAAEQKIFMDAVEDDVHRNIWLADSAKTHTAAGTYPDGTAYNIGDPDKFYNQMDGLLKKMQDAGNVNPGSEEIKLTSITAAGITDDEAEDVFQAMYENAPKVLRVLKNKGTMLAYYVSDSVLYNYLKSLRNDGTEAARMQKINGIERVTYNGIPLIPINVDEHIDADFAAAFPRDWAILTTPENLGLVLNATDSWAETRFWFNPDENENRQRTQFHMGADYILPELISMAHNN